jgi:hypothetical protein
MSCAASRATAHLRDVRDEIEMALRAPGDFVTISRKVADAILDDVGVIARLIREMAERDRE